MSGYLDSILTWVKANLIVTLLAGAALAYFVWFR